MITVAAAEPWDNAYLYELQPRIGVPITITALLASRSGGHKPMVELNDRGWENGAEVWPQVTPRPLRFQYSMASPFILNLQESFAELMAGGLEARREAYASPEWRARMNEEYRTARSNFGAMWDGYEIGLSTAHPELNGRRVVEVAEERGVAPLDAMLDLALDEPDLGLRVGAILTNDDEGEVAKLLLDEHCTLGLSDAGAHVTQLCDAPQGTDLLGNWVRDRELMPVEQGVRKLTGVQADIFGFEDRGYLREGMSADVVVFDADTIGPGPLRRIRDFPANAERLTADAPTGVTHVLVNGTPIRVDEQPLAIEETGSSRPDREARTAAVNPDEVARAYFARMRAGERVDELFADDAEIKGFGRRTRGKAAIAEIYREVQDASTPQPELVAITTAGNRVFGEVRVALADGTFLHVVDVFEVDDDRITSLTYFNADYPAPARIRAAPARWSPRPASASTSSCTSFDCRRAVRHDDRARSSGRGARRTAAQCCGASWDRRWRPDRRGRTPARSGDDNQVRSTSRHRTRAAVPASGQCAAVHWDDGRSARRAGSPRRRAAPP